jgi:hypothetical protein
MPVNLTKPGTRHQSTVAAGVALASLFGFLAIANPPIQSLPTIEELQVTIANFWRASTQYSAHSRLLIAPRLSTMPCMLMRRLVRPETTTIKRTP